MQGGQNWVEVTVALTVIYKKERLFCGYFSFFLSTTPWSPIYCWPALDSEQIKNLIWLSRTLVNVMEGYFANEIVQSCG